jgi:peroxiredoxin
MASRIVMFLGLIVLAVFLADLLSPSQTPRESVREPVGKLAVGAPAPDFSAIATDGRVIRLSNLRGKVVVLDFWATWCPPCRVMIPHERELVKKRAGKPFVFLGISADEDLDELRQVMTTERITWPTIHAGGSPLLRQYGITHLPTIFVLDRDGVIRFKDVRGAGLKRAVDGLLAAAH